MRLAYSPKQADVLLNANARWNLLVGATRSGKTFVSYDLLLKRMRQQPPGPCVLIGRTRQTLVRNVLDPMRERFGHRWVSNIHHDSTVDLFGRRCYVFGADDEQSKTKIQGMGVVYAYGDEFATWNQSFFKMLQSRLSVPGARFDGTANPEGPYHWAKVELIDRTGDLDIKLWHFVLDDNPFLDPVFVANLKAEYAGTVWYQRMILGLWVQAQGAIYDMFQDAVHVVDSLPGWPVHTYLVPIDYATGNPTAFLKLAVVTEPKSRISQVYGIDEYYWDSRARGRQKTDAEYAQDLKAFIAKTAPTIYVDPSAASFKAQLRKDNVHGVKDADNSVLDGIRLVSSFLSNRRLFFVRGKTPNLLREMQGYVWDPTAQKKGEDKPLKENDHACFVAGTMVETIAGPKPIEDVCVGDLVATRVGHARVIESGCTVESATVYTVVFSDARTLTATANHPIFVQGRGFVPVSELRNGDEVEVWQSKRLCSTGSSFADTPSPSDGQTGCISLLGSPTRSAGSGAFMKRFGGSFMGQFRRAILFITRTATRLTTRLTTLNACFAVGTSKTTNPDGANKARRRNGWLRLPEFARWLPFGIAQRLGESSIPSWVGGPGLGGHQLTTPASSVGGLTPPSPEPVMTDSAQIPVRPPGGGHQASMTRSEPACRAEGHLRSTASPSPGVAPVRVVCVTPGLRELPVYNLAVDGTPEYYANGVLVHNCDALRYGIYSYFKRDGLVTGPVDKPPGA